MKELLEKIADQKRVKSVSVYKSGETLYEYYARNSGQDIIEPVNSITKTVLSLLLGIAIDKGYIESLDDDIRRYVPESKESTILEHITMTSGMDWGAETVKEVYNEELIKSNSWIDYICSKRTVEMGRGVFKYNGGSSHLVGKAISNATGKLLEDFARENLFSPLGIELLDSVEPLDYSLSDYSWKRSRAWDRDPEGNSIGSFGLSLKAVDLLKLGGLILNRGEFSGVRVVSARYIEEMTEPSVKAGLLHYGYHIWVRKIRGVDTVSALGYGNQYLTVIPEHEAVIVILSQNDGEESPEIEKLHGELVKLISKEK